MNDSTPPGVSPGTQLVAGTAADAPTTPPSQAAACQWPPISPDMFPSAQRDFIRRTSTMPAQALQVHGASLGLLRGTQTRTGESLPTQRVTESEVKCSVCGAPAPQLLETREMPEGGLVSERPHRQMLCASCRMGEEVDAEETRRPLAGGPIDGAQDLEPEASSGRQDRVWFRITVTDTGSGMSREQVLKVFDDSQAGTHRR